MPAKERIEAFVDALVVYVGQAQLLLKVIWSVCFVWTLL